MGEFMTFPCQQGITISGQCKIKGDPGDNPEGWTLGLIQLQWIETNWGSYRGQSNSDGSCFLQRARPPARAAKGCRDTLGAGEIFVNNAPGLDRTVATAGTPFPIAMTAQFSDAPTDAYPLTRPNSLTGKANFLGEVQLEFHFCTILTLKDPAGISCTSSTCFGMYIGRRSFVPRITPISRLIGLSPQTPGAAPQM
jgi:hypothetical protein